MAERLHEVALATHDPHVLAAVGTAFHQVSRGVRQSLTLRARFAAGAPFAERPVRATAQPAPAADTSPPRPERTGWNEYERLACDELIEDFDAGPIEGERPDVERAERTLQASLTPHPQDLTSVSRAPVLAAMLALRPHAAALSKRTALLGGAGALRLVDSS